MPIGAIARPVAQSDLELQAIVASLDGARIIRYTRVGPRTNAASLGREVAEQLLSQGAAEILDEAKRNESLVPNPESLRLT